MHNETKALYCLVQTVVDGDTINVETEQGRRTIRLNHIDAPEVGEPYFLESRQFLVNAILEDHVFVHPRGTDRYGRMIADIITEDTYNISAELLVNGLAFHFKKYSQDPAMDFYEKEAQKKEINLWSKPEYYTRWVARTMKGQRYYHKKGQYFEIPDYVLKFVIEMDQTRHVTQEQFEEFERKSREALRKSGNLHFREISRLLEDSK